MKNYANKVDESKMTWVCKWMLKCLICTYSGKRCLKGAKNFFKKRIGVSCLHA